MVHERHIAISLHVWCPHGHNQRCTTLTCTQLSTECFGVGLVGCGSDKVQGLPLCIVLLERIHVLVRWSVLVVNRFKEVTFECLPGEKL